MNDVLFGFPLDLHGKAGLSVGGKANDLIAEIFGRRNAYRKAFFLVRSSGVHHERNGFIESEVVSTRAVHGRELLAFERESGL
jgi:hypothetical protein